MLRVRSPFRDGHSQPATHSVSPASIAWYLQKYISTDSRDFSADDSDTLFHELSPSPSSRASSTNITYWIKRFETCADRAIECNIYALVYIIRFLKKDGGVSMLTDCNWRPILSTAFIIASNVLDFKKKIEPWCLSVHLKTLNAREFAFLQAIELDWIVSASEYTDVYFKLRDFSHTRSVLTLQRGFVADGKCSRPVLSTSLQAIDLHIPEHLKKGCKHYTDLLRRLKALDLHGVNLDIHEYLTKDGEQYTEMFMRVWRENRERL